MGDKDSEGYGACEWSTSSRLGKDLAMSGQGPPWRRAFCRSLSALPPNPASHDLVRFSAVRSHIIRRCRRESFRAFHQALRFQACTAYLYDYAYDTAEEAAYVYLADVPFPARSSTETRHGSPLAGQE